MARRVDERRLDAVPKPVWALLSGALVLQIVFRLYQPAPVAQAEALPMPPTADVLEMASGGEALTLARSLNLWLQGYDHQPGISVPYARLDYHKVREWLTRIVSLDPEGQYPFLAATRLYGAVRVPDKQRLMLDWVYATYPGDPGRRWRWLGGCTGHLGRMDTLPVGSSLGDDFVHFASGHRPREPQGWHR